jgi:nucleotide-binding universal stress UspA family protein
MYTHILAPIDGSPTSERGLQEAIGLARDQKARLRLLHVVDKSWLMLDTTGMVNWADVIQSLREDGEQLVSRAKAMAAARGVEAEGVVVETLGQRVADRILSEARAWQADIIVIGTHGRRGFKHLVLGSDAEAVLHDAPAPVLLIRAVSDRDNSEVAR